LVAERRPLQIERDATPLGLLVLVELAEHGREAVGRPRGQAAGGGEAADREVGAVELRAAVDEVDRLLPPGHPAILYPGVPRVECAPMAARLALALLLAAGLPSCVRYEYEHEFWLDVDGSGRVNIT